MGRLLASGSTSFFGRMFLFIERHIVSFFYLGLGILLCCGPSGVLDVQTLNDAASNNDNASNGIR